MADIATTMHEYMIDCSSRRPTWIDGGIRLNDTLNGPASVRLDLAVRATDLGCGKLRHGQTGIEKARVADLAGV
jgi:hypothetical protein